MDNEERRIKLFCKTEFFLDQNMNEEERRIRQYGTTATHSHSHSQSLLQVDSWVVPIQDRHYYCDKASS
jgi:hypothetical protein